MNSRTSTDRHRRSILKDAGVSDDDKIVRSVRKWVELFVVDLNLCPFARRELLKNRLRFHLTEATNEERLLLALRAELELLKSEQSVETTLLIHPNVLQDFFDYNRFLSRADQLLVRMKLEGVFQIASFHPDYQFAGTAPDDAENYTNRAPYPILHLLREDSVEQAIADYPDAERIPSRNIVLMKSLGPDRLIALAQKCLNDAGEKDG